MDNLTIAQRSQLMSGIRGKDTKPELAVRSVVHRMGYRYRLHGKELPGKPDLIFPARAKIIFVHGCFWHGHACPTGRRRPKSNCSYWNSKLDGNMKRDRATTRKLRRLGWGVLVLWECQLKDQAKLRKRLARFLGDRHE